MLRLIFVLFECAFNNVRAAIVNAFLFRYSKTMTANNSPADQDPPKRGRPRKFDREDVILRSMKVFWENGFERTSLEDLVDATGVGAQSLYNAIGNKREIFVQVLEQYLSTVALDARRQLENGQSAIDAICSIFPIPSEVRSQNRPPGCLLVMSSSEMVRQDAPEIAAFVDQQMAGVIAGFTKAIERGQATGEIRKTLMPGSTAQLLATLLHGSQSRIRFGATDGDMRQIRVGIRNLLAA